MSAAGLREGAGALQADRRLRCGQRSAGQKIAGLVGGLVIDEQVDAERYLPAVLYERAAVAGEDFARLNRASIDLIKSEASRPVADGDTFDHSPQSDS